MKILIVEDHPENVRELEQSVLSRYEAGTVLIARSRDSALEALNDQAFDLVVLDRRIPTKDGLLDEDVAHGDAIYAYIRAETRGIPIRYWTAFPDDEYYSQMMRHVQQEDVWGSGEIPTVDVISKSRFDLINEQLDSASAALAALDRIELRQHPGRAVELSEEERRVIRIAVKRLGGDAAVVSLLGGGYSDAKVLKVEVLSQERCTLRAVGKLTQLPELPKEVKRYNYLHRLAPGAAPNIVCQVKYGAGHLGGTFYQLADGYDRSMFDLLGSDPEKAAAVVTNLRRLTKGWTDAAKPVTARVGDVRRLYASDQVLQQVIDRCQLDLGSFERQEVTIMDACTHGDLHGENVLVNDEGDPILIDFGEIGEHPCAIDPITLELSAIFHAAGLLARTGWPSIHDAGSWPDQEKYLAKSPYAAFVRGCREWSWENARGGRATYVTAYAYLIRQFKYADTNKDIACAILRALIGAYKET